MVDILPFLFGWPLGGKVGLSVRDGIERHSQCCTGCTVALVLYSLYCCACVVLAVLLRLCCTRCTVASVSPCTITLIQHIQHLADKIVAVGILKTGTTQTRKLRILFCHTRTAPNSWQRACGTYCHTRTVPNSWHRACITYNELHCRQGRSKYLCYAN